MLFDELDKLLDTQSFPVSGARAASCGAGKRVEAFAAKPSGGSISPLEDHFHAGG